MDTKRLECIAEDYIAQELQRGGLLVAKPKFDIDGADLLAFLWIKDASRFARIQSKGRTLKKGRGTSIRIPKEYVLGAFAVFLFIQPENDEHSLFCFFVKDIKEWKKTIVRGREYYFLSINYKSYKDKTSSKNLLAWKFSKKKMTQLKKTIKLTPSKTEKFMYFAIKKQQEMRKLVEETSELKSIIAQEQLLQELIKAHQTSIDLAEEMLTIAEQKENEDK